MFRQSRISLLGALICFLSRGHADRHVRNLSRSESAPLAEVSEWRCACCFRRERRAGWHIPPREDMKQPAGITVA